MERAVWSTTRHACASFERYAVKEAVCNQSLGSSQRNLIGFPLHSRCSFILSSPLRHSNQRRDLHLISSSIHEIRKPKSIDNLQLDELKEAQQKLSQGRFRETEQLLDRAHSIIKMSVGEESDISNSILKRLFSTLVAQNKFEQAEKIAFQMLISAEKNLKNEPSSSARTLDLEEALNCVILCFKQQERILEASGFCNRLVELFQPSNGSPHTADSVIGLAKAVLEMGDIYSIRSNKETQAEKCYFQSLATLELLPKAVQGKISPSDELRANLVKARAQNNLGVFCFSMNQLSNSEKLYTQSLSTIEHHLNDAASEFEKSLKTLIELEKGKVHFNLGELALYRKDYNKAEKEFEVALKAFESESVNSVNEESDTLWQLAENGNNKDIMVADCLRQLATVYQGKSNSIFAEGLYKRAIATFEQANFLNKNSREALKSAYDNYSKLLRSKSRVREAETIEGKRDALKV